MKLFDDVGITKLITLIKSNFISNSDTINTTEISIDSAPTSASNNLVSSGGVFTSLGAKESTSNKVTTLTASSTDTEYPSAKCVYDIIGDVESQLSALR